MDPSNNFYNGNGAATNHYTSENNGNNINNNSSRHKKGELKNIGEGFVAASTTNLNDELITKADSKGQQFHDIGLSKTNYVEEGIMISNDRNNDIDQQMKHLKLMPTSMDDLRISKILKRLLAEENPEHAVELCKKLDTAVRSQCNALYICRSFDYLFDAMINVLKKCPTECLQQASDLLGVMAYINRSDYAIYKMHITKSYTNHPNIRKYLMRALKKTISCDAVNLSLLVYSERLLNLLKEYLENCDAAENFIAVSETIAEFSKHYVHAFEQQFTDIVDIIIGWLLEIEQPTQFKRHCAKILQNFSPFFLKELQFTYNLLEQFVEDLNASNEELAYMEINNDVKCETVKRIGAFIGAFSSILKALSSKEHCIQLTTNAETILTSAFISVRKSAELSLMSYNQQLLSNEELIINLNEFLCIMLMNKNVEIITASDIEMVIELQLQHFSQFNIKQQCSVLCLAWTIVCQLKTKLPITFIDIIMGSQFSYNNQNIIELKENPMQILKMNINSKTHKFLLKIYQEILKIKNVPLLQRAYYHILNDIGDIIKHLQKSNDTKIVTATTRTQTVTTPVATTQWEALLHFYLNALTALATQAYSIISMYALQPSILELLIYNCQAANQDFWLRYLSLHESLLQLIIVYCCKNHNFRQTSRLLTQHPEITSPSSENFCIILQFLSALLKWSNISKTTLTLIIDWVAQILQDCQTQYSILIAYTGFHDLCNVIAMGAFKQPKLYAKLLLILLKYPKLPQTVLMNIRDVALSMIDSIDMDCSRLYCKILGKIPIHICIQSYRKDDQQLFMKYKQNMHTLCQIEKNATSSSAILSSTSLCCSIRAKFFKPFIDSLNNTVITTMPASVATSCTSGTETKMISSLPPYEIYFEKSNCCPVTTPNIKSNDSNLNSIPLIQNPQQFMEFTELLQKHWSLLAYHLQYENAKYCVQQRLRTALGKPQETFLAFEAIIMKYTQQLNESSLSINNQCSYNLIQAMDLQQNCHMLLGFLENLEKHIYNAAYGTAYAMPQLDKQVKTFFRVNHATCNDWFKRIHPSINLIALHSLQPELIIRLSEVILNMDNIHTNLVVMDRTIVTLLWALLNCGVSDSMKGLLVWLKVKLNNRYDWIQHIAEQCDGHLEQAIVGYKNVLQISNDLKNYENCVREFLKQQLIECLYSTARWSEINQIQQQNDNEPLIYKKSHLDLMDSIYTNYCNYTKYNEIIKLNLLDLSEWQEIECTQTQIQNKMHKKMLCPKVQNYSYNKVLMNLKEACVHEALSINIHSNNYNNNSLILNTIQTIVQRSLCEVLLNGCEPMMYNKEFLEFLILNNVCEKLSLNYNNNNNDEQQQTQIERQEQENFTFFMPTFIASKQLMWSLIIAQRSVSSHNNINNRTQTNNYINKLFLNTASSARMENNMLYCHSLLERFFTLKGFNSDLNTIATQIINTELKVDFDDTDMLRGVTELAKCLYTYTNSLNNAVELEASCCNQILEITRNTPQRVSTNECCEMFITIADWLNVAQRSNCNYNSIKEEVQFSKLINQLPELNVCRNMIQTIGQLTFTNNEYNIGKLLQASTLLKNDYGNAWLAFGNWCYRWGKKLMENRSKMDGKIMDNETNHGKLSEQDITLITNALHNDFNVQTINQIINYLQLHLLNSLNDDGNVEELCNDSASAIDILKNDIRKIAELSDAQLQTISTVWRQAHKGIYGLYEEATRAYFKYIRIQSDYNTIIEKQVEKEQIGVEESTLVTITLRILRLIVKHAAGLQEVLEEGLSNTPLLPWRIIIPQLFSRLSHHEPYVRRSVSELLCRLSSDQPQLIIFPAVVGAQKELVHNENNQEILFNCFESLCSKLAEQAPDTVHHVTLLVKELRRIALLWEEYWLHSLGQFYAEYLPLYNSLELHMKKDPKSTSLAAKCKLFMEHLTKDFELIAQITAKEPETDYERIFQERFKHHIDDILTELKKPFNLTQSKVCFVKIKHLYGLFQQKPLRGNSSTMKVHDLSPILAQLQNSNITMPGVDATVHIKSVDNLLYVLPTKTKPKKLAFYGSDGQRYTFLFKGQEDLHLDERIMQFLSISNSMMARSRLSDNFSKTDYFKAQHYSVIPLGSRSGFIKWVDGCTPLFSIYKKWQHRDALLKLQQKERQQNDSNIAEQSPNVANVLRPSELFYEKLQPLLAEHNLKITDPRKQWPIQVLKTVLRQLTKETPSDLLSKEIWCYASNAVDWHKSTRRYTISVAVMSIIGYIIGLGDRHLDNILIKLSTGEIVHIDYNVCFEKGKTLRVPEKVPCRLTPNILNAFGLTGIEGTFRLSCEYVLKILRKERETLLTLLEAFVYDPLVDWAVNNDGTATTSSRLTTAHIAALSIAALDNQATLASNINSKAVQQHKHKEDISLLKQNIVERCQELKPLWCKFRNDLEEQLKQVDCHLEKYKNYKETVKSLKSEYDTYNKLQTTLKELKSKNLTDIEWQTLQTLSKRYMNYKEKLKKCDETYENLMKLKNDYQITLKIYNDEILNTINIENILQSAHLLDSHQYCGINSVMKRQQQQDNAKTLLDEELIKRIELAFCEYSNDVKFCQELSIECIHVLMQYNHIQLYNRNQQHDKLQNHSLIKYNKRQYNDNIDDKFVIPYANISENFKIEKDFKKKQQYHRMYFLKLISIYEQLNTKMTILQEDKKIEQQQYLSFVPIDIIKQKYVEAMSLVKATTTKAMASFGITNNHYVIKLLLSKYLPQLINDLVIDLTNTSETFKNIQLLKFHINSIEMLQEFLKNLSSTFYNSNKCEYIRLLLKCLKNLDEFCEHLCLMPEHIYAYYSMSERNDDFNDTWISNNTNANKNANDDDINLDLPDVIATLSNFENFKLLMNKFDLYLNEFCDSIKCFQKYLLDETLKYKNIIVKKEITIICEVNIEEFMKSVCNSMLKKLIKLLKSYAAHHIKDTTTQTSLTGLVVVDVCSINDILFNIIQEIEDNFLKALTKLSIQLIYDNDYEQDNNANDLINNDNDNEELNNLYEIVMTLYENLNASYKLCYKDKIIQHQWKLVQQHLWIMSSHYWYNEHTLKDLLPQTGYDNIITKSQMLHNIKEFVKRIMYYKEKLKKSFTQLENYKKYFLNDIESTNDNVNIHQHECLQIYENAHIDYTFSIDILTHLLTYFNTLLQVESMMENDNNVYFDIIQQYERAYCDLNKSETEITTIERTLIEILDPGNNADYKWLRKILHILDDTIRNTEKNITELENDSKSHIKTINNAGQHVENLLQCLVSLESRHLLKILMKYYKHQNKMENETIVLEIRNLQQTIKAMQLKLSDLHFLLTANDIDLQMIKEKLNEWNNFITDSNDKLLLIIEPFLQQQQHGSDNNGKSPSNYSPFHQRVEKPTVSINYQIIEQKRNVYAVSVWKRIRMKLEGRDPDPNLNRRSTITEQVDFVIREALNENNLASLYEGWTPWV